MAHKIVDKVLSVVESENPWPKSRLKGSRAAGIRFEKAVAKTLKRRKNIGPVLYPVWLEYSALPASGKCSPDIVLPEQSVVIECKLTETEYAISQLQGLYLPVVSCWLGRSVRGVVVTRHLTKTTNTDAVFGSLKAALDSDVEFPIVHWLGRGRL